MKLLLICLFAVHITFVVCTYRRHGASSRNSVSFLLRKVCVEVTGLKEEVAELKEEVDGLKEENSSLKEDVTELETEVTGRNEEIDGLKEEIDGLKEEIDGLKEENSALNDRVSATEQPGPTSAFSTYGLDKTYVDNVVVWGMPYLNKGSNYNTTTGKYCAEYNGTYLFHLNLYKVGGTNRVLGCLLLKDSKIQTGEDIAYATVPTETSDSSESSTTAITHLEQGDCVYVGACEEYINLAGDTTFIGTLLFVDSD